jgi:hypothetical protein
MLSEAEITELLKLLGEGGAAWAAGIAAGIVGTLWAAVRVYRLPLVQRLVVGLLGAVKVSNPERFAWDNLPKLVQLAIVFVLSAAGALISALGTGTAVAPALVASVVAGMMAIGGNELLDGFKRAPLELKSGNSQPPISPLTRQNSLVVPLDPGQVPKA